jgi:hypothetical protein
MKHDVASDNRALYGMSVADVAPHNFDTEGIEPRCIHRWAHESPDVRSCSVQPLNEMAAYETSRTGNEHGHPRVPFL